MSQFCPHCESTNVIRNGKRTTARGILMQQYRCNDCSSSYSLELNAEERAEEYELDEVISYTRDNDWLESRVYSYKRIVITSAQNDTLVDDEFLAAIQSYCIKNNSGLVCIPVRHRRVGEDTDTPISYDQRIEPYLVENTIHFNDYNLKIYAGLKITATAENPLSGLDPLSKGNSIIVGHPQVQLRTLPNLDNSISDIITTTGSITQENYSNTKLGEKARFNHSLSAVVVEFDNTSFHLRHLNWDPESRSFCDLETQYLSTGESNQIVVEALVTGDEHVTFTDQVVSDYTYVSDDSMVNTLRPKMIIRHDSLDAYSISHHHRKNVFTQYAKWQSGMNSIEDEIRETVQYINSTTPEWSTSWIIQSNHNEHLLRWLNEVDIKTEPWNAKIYHYLMYNMLKDTHMGDSGTVHPDPFQLIATPWLKPNVKFSSRGTRFKVLGIEVGQHGDMGVNGSRGSARAHARMPDKMIVGHSHSPSIEKGCYTVGTSSRLKLEYNRGASTWHHAHVIIHPNGKRQMVFITPDGWRL